MTKANEITILRNAIELLGDDTYCGPWLASVVDEVEATIRSDYFPTITIAASVEEGNRIIARAKAEAKTIADAAKADAAKTMDRAERYKNSVEEALRLALRNLTSV